MKKAILVLLLVALCIIVVICSSEGLVIDGISLGGYKYDHANRYTVGGTELADKVTDLDISWLAGNVSISYHSGNEIRVSETANRAMKANEEMRWWLDGSKLYVKYAESGFRSADNLNKQLTVLLPDGLKLNVTEINTVSAAVQAADLAAETINLNTVSGSAVISVSTAEKIDIDTVSGNAQVEAASADQININTVSGNAFISVMKLNALDAGSVSGNVRISMPENAGFTADVDSVSGDISGTYPMQMNAKNRYIGGDGSCRISVNTVSGDIQLDKH